MITSCPACKRQFRIYARQLSAARGLVQCGYCGEQFNALDRLQDHAMPGTVPAPAAAAAGGYPGVEPEFDIPGHLERESAVEQSPAVGTGEGAGDRLQAAAGPVAEGVEPADAGPREEEEAVEALLEEPPPRKTPVFRRLLWMTASLLLLLAIAAQLLWFNRDTLLARYPQYMPLATDLCARLGCELVRDPDTSSIVLLNRDVRDHPRYEEALLINVTIENQADAVREYPDIRLILFDPNGEVSGYRDFTPDEYLDQDVEREAGMPPRVPVHLVLEVTGAGESAVSFEFRFL